MEEGVEAPKKVQKKDVEEVDVKEEDKEVKGKRKSLLKSMGEAKALSKLDNQSF